MNGRELNPQTGIEPDLMLYTSQDPYLAPLSGVVNHLPPFTSLEEQHWHFLAFMQAKPACAVPLMQVAILHPAPTYCCFDGNLVPPRLMPLLAVSKDSQGEGFEPSKHTTQAMIHALGRFRP